VTQKSYEAVEVEDEQNTIYSTEQRKCKQTSVVALFLNILYLYLTLVGFHFGGLKLGFDLFDVRPNLIYHL
jgi:hypothetical protein